MGLSLWVTFLMVSPVGQGADAPATRPGGGEPYTHQRWVQDYRRWAVRVTVEAYQRVGKRDPKWDRQAIAYLREAAPTMIRESDGPIAVPPLTPARRLVQAGCDDPLVLTCYGMALRGAGRLHQTERVLRRALPGFRKHRYPAILEAWAALELAMCLQRLTGGNAPDEAAFAAHAMRRLAAAAGDGSFTGPQRRFYFAHCRRMIIQNLPNLPQTLYETLDRMPRADPWSVDMVKAYCHIGLMAGFRQKLGPRREPTPEQQQWYQRQQRRTASYLIKAWQRHPEHPESATEMIQLVMAAGGDLAERRQWFDRAVAAQFDYMPAYDFLRMSLRPIEGGSDEAMIAFGEECLATGRFDTPVPLQYVELLLLLNKSRGLAAWQRPGVYPRVRRLFCGIDASPAWTAAQKAGFKSLHAAAAWQCGRVLEAKRLVDELGDEVRLDAFQRVGASVDLVREKLLDS